MSYADRDKYGMYKDTRSAGPGPALMGADTLIGDNVVNAAEEDLGEIKEIMLDMQTGQVAYAVLDRTWRSGERFDPANVESRKMQYLFVDQNGYTFMDNETYEQVALQPEVIGDDKNFLLDQISVDVLFYNERPVGITLPSHIVMKVVECEPGVKGDTATNATKGATVETGLKVQVPLFIKEGEKIKIDTRTGDYIERING